MKLLITMMKKHETANHGRYEAIDIAKGIGIILIVLGHLEPGTYLMRFVYSFHLFLFFICSGFVGKRYEERSVSKIIYSNVKRLLLPYFFWCIISQLIDIVSGNIDVFQAFKNVLFFDANIGWNAALWFLLSLFFADCICGVIIKSKRWVQYLIGCFFFVLWILLEVYKVVVPFGLYTVPIAALFWLIGYWFNCFSILNRIANLSKTNRMYLGGAMFLANISLGTVFNTVISIYHSQYQKIVFSFVAGIAGVLFVFIISQSVSKFDVIKKFLVYYGQNTMSILCTHYFILRTMGELSSHIIGHNLWRYTSTVKSLVLTTIIMVAYYPFLIIINKIKHKYPKVKHLI